MRLTRSWAIVTASVVLAFLAVGSTQARADYILQSATLGQTGQQGGLDVGSDQFLAARFHVATTVVVDHVGGHLGEYAPGGLFAAIIALPGPDALPAFLPLDITSHALADTTFVAPFPSADVLVPLTTILGPGDYALVFGSGAFGATGRGIMPTNNVDTSQASYFHYTDIGGNSWNNSQSAGSTRFVVTGTSLTVVPEPSSLAMVGIAALTGHGLGLVQRRRKRT